MGMKRILTGSVAAFALAAALAGCKENFPTYNGPSYVMFADSLSIHAVQQSGEAFVVPVVATRTSDKDRTFGVEVIYKGSNALYNRHYTLESSTVVIKAGENVGNVRVRGNYDEFDKADSLGFRLRLISLEDVEWDLYGLETKVVMYKCCPFDINNFTGYCLLNSLFFSSTANRSTTRLITSEVVEGEDNTILLKDYFSDGYDIKVRLDPTDPLLPRFILEGTPVVGDSRYFFNYIYDDGRVRIRNYEGLESYFNTCESYAVQYVIVYIENEGTVGAYANVLEWLTDTEALDYL